MLKNSLYHLNNRIEHKFCKIILIKFIISSKTYLYKIILHIFTVHTTVCIIKSMSHFIRNLKN